jgi:predicted porin
MQKKLLGMAVAAALAVPAVALAQSAVQVYGTVHLSFNQTKFGDAATGLGPGTTKYGVNSHASNFGLRSTETLGGGLTAWMQMEFNYQFERRTGNNNANAAATGNGTARNSGLGLRGAFGNIYYGTWESPWAQTFRLWDVGTIGGWGPTTSIMGRRETTSSAVSRNAGLVGNDFLIQAAPTFPGSDGGNLGYPLWRRFASSVFYESPVFEGVQAKIAYLPNETKSTVGTVENPSAWSASLTWTGLGGRARAFLANMQAKDFSSVGQTDGGYTVGGGYDFGVANVGASYESYKYKPAVGEVRAKQWGVGLAVPLGPGKIGASYAKAKNLEGPGVPLANDTQAKMMNLGYEWGLSKRTALGFGAAKITNGANQTFTWTGMTAGQQGAKELVLPGVSQTNLFVSMRHSF